MTPSASIAARTAALGLTLVLALAGCSSDGNTYGNTTGVPATGVYVIQNTPVSGTTAASASVLEFSPSASGAATPIATIANTGVTALAFLAVDGYGNLYTTASQGTTGTSLIEYLAGSSNNTQPIRSLPFNTTTGLSDVSGLAVDPTGDIYASNDPTGVLIFSSTATGSVAPADTIPSAPDSLGGDLSTLQVSYADAVDTNGNLYVVNTPPTNAIAVPPITDPIVVFAPGATGNVAPTRSLGGALTTLTVGSARSIATDTAGNLYVANVVSGVSSILIFSPTATGNTPPLRDITGSNTQLGCLGGIALDTEGYLYVVSAPCSSSPTASPSVLKFSTTGDGNIAPVTTFTSTAWTNADPTLSIAVY
jgi:hypothetical protein